MPNNRHYVLTETGLRWIISHKGHAPVCPRCNQLLKVGEEISTTVRKYHSTQYHTACYEAMYITPKGEAEV